MSQLPLRLKMGHLKHFLFISVLFCFTLFGFQNCSSPLEGESGISSVAQNAPFAFDGNMDTIAHMSCGGMVAGYDPAAYFSFAAGAYNAGSGIKFNDNFLSYTGGLNPVNKQRLLTESPANKNSKFQIAVRNVANVKQILGGLAEGQGYGSYAGDITSSDVALSLPQTTGGNFVNNFSAGQVYAENDMVTGNVAQGARDQMNAGNGLLGFTFSNDNYPSGGVGPVETRAYGRGLVVSFVNPAHISTAGVSNQLNSAVEYNLEDGSLVGGSWTCSQSLRYMIVRPEDIGVTSACGGQANRTPGVEEVPANQTQANELAELRKFLPVSKWGVDMAGRCIVPKNGVVGSCYGNSNVIRYPGNGSVCSMGLNTCPAYVSICQRN